MITQLKNICFKTRPLNEFFILCHIACISTHQRSSSLKRQTLNHSCWSVAPYRDSSNLPQEGQHREHDCLGKESGHQKSNSEDGGVDLADVETSRQARAREAGVRAARRDEQLGPLLPVFHGGHSRGHWPRHFELPLFFLC